MRTEELLTIQSNTTYSFADLANSFMYKFRFGNKECFNKTSLLKEELLYQWVLSIWKQYSDGTPVPNVNHISQSEFNTIVNRLKELTQ
jgi:hypothetical protein